MLIVMSISRFAYTPILPFMQQDTSMDNQEAGFSYMELFRVFSWRCYSNILYL